MANAVNILKSVLTVGVGKQSQQTPKSSTVIVIAMGWDGMQGTADGDS